MKEFFDTMNNAMNKLEKLRSTKPATTTVEYEDVEMEVEFNHNCDIIAIYIEDIDVTHLLEWHPTLFGTLTEQEAERRSDNFCEQDSIYDI